MGSSVPDMPAVQRPQLKLLLASPRGFCAGVERAIRIVELSLAKYGAPVYVRHEIVHNRFVVEKLEPCLLTNWTKRRMARL
jgi:4-hydroxy-3-methylbut-2-enyl diphosphate reductase